MESMGKSIVALLLAACVQGNGSADDSSHKAARINNEYITWREVDSALKLDLLPKVDPETRQKMRWSKLKELATERLFLQEAREQRLIVTETELDERMDRERKRFGTDEEYVQSLRIGGTTRTERREYWRKMLMEGKLYRFVIYKAYNNPDVNTPGLLLDLVTPQQVREFFEKNREQYKPIEHVSFYRIAFQFGTEKEKAAKRALAESVLRKHLEGADFGLLAGGYSEVWSRSPRGEPFPGVLELKRVNEHFSGETTRLLFDVLKEKEVSGIVEDRNSLNLFQLLQHVNLKAETFEEAQGKIRNMLENEKHLLNKKQLRDELLKRAWVEPRDLFERDR